MTTVVDRLSIALADRYTIEREIGRGGMATVYLAQDLKHDRTVAIKVLQPELSATIGTERFDREIRLAARLQHPHILALYDSGNADGLLYYVMPFINGESLRDRMNREHLLPIDDAIQITREVADALGYAHSAGVIHRDIKPENILLTGGHALVAHFGIARAVSSASSEAKLTETGMALGTPLYMSPEQAVGDEVGPTSDLYSLACVLYEMLAGTPPFVGPNSRAIMARHAMDPVPGLQVIRETVPDEVEDAVLFALAKVPADRPQTALQFTEAMGAPLGSTTGRRTASSRITMSRRAARTSEIAQLQPVARRKPWLWIAAAVVGLGVLGIAGWKLLGGKRPAAADSAGLDRHHIGVLYFEDLSPQHDLGYLSDGLTEGLITALNSVTGLSVVSRSGAALYRGSALGRDSIARALQVGTLVTGTVEPEGDSIRVGVRVSDDAGTEFGRTTFKAGKQDFIRLSENLVEQAAGQIRKRIGEEVQVRQTRAGTESAEAWALLQRAQGARRKGDSLALAEGGSAGFTEQYRAADSLAGAAERQDPKWVDPIVLRATLAYWRSRRAGDDAALMASMIDTGLMHANRALALERDNPDALEMRGSLNYWRWLIALEPDSAKAARLLATAQADLEMSTKVRPTQASAYAMLSHMYANLPDKSLVDVILAATKALETDAYLSNADVIINRLAHANYDEGNFAAADRWCSEGRRRFPSNWRFYECQLLLMTSRFKTAEPARAWAIADSMVALSPAGVDRRYQQLNAQVLVAGILARAGQVDSARRLLNRTQDDPEADPSRDLANISAFVWLLAGDTTMAAKRVKDYLLTNPGRRRDFAENPNWWFRGIQNDPRYRQAVQGG
jgi:serine/threonine-protein kinase